MFLSKLFRNMRAKALVALASVTMVLGVGAATYFASSYGQNEVVETQAYNDFTTDDYVYLDARTNWDQAGAWFKIKLAKNPNESHASYGATGTKVYGSVYKVNFPAYSNTDVYRMTRWGKDNGVDTEWNSFIMSTGSWITKGQFVTVTEWDAGNWVNTVNVTIKEVVNGVEKATKTLPIGTGKSMSTSQFVDALGSYYGYTISDNFYTSKTGGSKVSSVSSATTIYARYTATSTTTGYFSLTFFMNAMWPTEANLPTITVWDANNTANASFPGVAMTKVSYEYGIVSFSIPNGATKIVICVNGWTSGGAQTVDITTWAEKTSNLYVLTGTSDGKYSGAWHYTNYAAATSSNSTLPGYYFMGGSSDSDWKTTSLNHMGPNLSNMSAKGHIEGFSVTASQYFKVTRRTTASAVDQYLGYDHLDDASKALTNSSGNALITDGGGEDGNMVFSAAETISVYLTSSDTISVVSERAKAGAGYIYVTGTLSSISFKAYKDTSGTQEIHTGNLNIIDGNATCSTAAMNDTLGLHRVSIYSLRGTDGNAVKSFKLGSSGVIVAPTASESNTPAVYYLASTGGVYNNNATGKLAKATYEIAEAIADATDDSVCNLSPAQCSSLLTDYATWSGSSFYGSAYIDTYNKAATEKADMITDGSHGKVALSSIVAQMNKIIAGGSGARIVPGSSNAQSPLTTTLWIVLASGLAGLAAIGTAYFVSKKKKRPQA